MEKGRRRGKGKMSKAEKLSRRLERKEARQEEILKKRRNDQEKREIKEYFEGG